MKIAVISREAKQPRGGRGISKGFVSTTLAIAMNLWPQAAKAEDLGMAVSVLRVARHCFTDRLTASGTLVARDTVELRPDRDGLMVSEVLVEPGDTVAKDQVLARLVSPKTPQDTVAIKAPVAGVLIGESAVVGAYASSGTKDPLFHIAAGGELELKAETLATNLSRVRRGTPAKIHVVGLGDIDGRVASIDEGVDAQTQLGTLRLSLARDPRLRVGGFARAEIDAGQDCGLTVPMSALLFGPDGAIVGTVQSDRVVMRRVTTGLVDGGDIEIRDGLRENDRVIARAAPFLRDGDHVRPVSK